MEDKRIRVLLIEDNPDDVWLLRETLAEPAGVQIQMENADRLSSGLARLAQGGVDVVLLALNLPDSRGLGTLAALHAQAPDVPVVVLSGLADEETAIRSVQQGAQDYLVKGRADSQALVRVLRHAIERHHLLSQLEHRTRELQASEVRFRKMIEENPDGIIVVDGDGVVRFVNSAAAGLFDRPAEELLGAPFGFPVVGEEPMEVEIVRQDGKTAVAEMRVAEVELHGETLFVTSLRDTTELVQLREKLRAMSLTDDLTGLYNRRGFFTLVQQQLKLAHRTGRKMSLLMVDVDGLKRINDTLGHHVGDQALIETADVLQETFRESDIVARIGGDEFVVLAVETDSASAEILTARLQENLQARNAQQNHRHELSLSCGVSHYNPESSCSVEELMRSADARMYEHKRRRQ